MNINRIGDLIAEGPAANTHGCRDYLVAVVTEVSDDFIKATVIEAASCTSCWQVGHDRDHVFAAVGDTVQYSLSRIMPAGDDWSADVKWEAF